MKKKKNFIIGYAPLFCTNNMQYLNVQQHYLFRSKYLNSTFLLYHILILKVHKMKVQELETWKEQCKKSKEEAKVIKEKVQFQSAIVKVWFYKIIQQRTQNLWNWIVCSCSSFSHLSEEKFEIAIWGCLVLPTSKPLTSKDNSGKIMLKMWMKMWLIQK